MEGRPLPFTCGSRPAVSAGRSLALRTPVADEPAGVLPLTALLQRCRSHSIADLPLPSQEHAKVLLCAECWPIRTGTQAHENEVEPMPRQCSGSNQ